MLTKSIRSGTRCSLVISRHLFSSPTTSFFQSSRSLSQIFASTKTNRCRSFYYIVNQFCTDNIDELYFTKIKFEEERNFTKVLEIQRKMLEIFRENFVTAPEETRTELFEHMLDMVGTYTKLGNFKAAFRYLNEGLELINDDQKYPIEKATVLERMGNLYIQEKRYEEALMVLKKAVELLKSDGELPTETYFRIAACYHELDQVEQGLEYFYNELNISTDPQDLMNIRTHIALCLQWLKKHEESVPFLIKNLEFIRTEPDQVLAMITSLNLLSYAYQGSKQFNKEVEVLLELIGFVKEYHGDFSQELSFTFTALGYAYHNLGDHQKSLDAFYHSLSINTDLHGYDHIQTFTAMTRVGDVLHNLFTTSLYSEENNDNEEETELRDERFEERLNLYLMHYSHIRNSTEIPAEDLCKFVKEISEMYHFRNDFAEALYYMCEADNFARQCYPPNSIEFADHLFQMAEAYQAKKNFSEAKNLFLQSLKILTKQSQQSEKVMLLYGKLGYLFFAMKNFDQSILYFESCLALCEQNSFNSLAKACFSLGYVHSMLKNYSISAKYFARCVQYWSDCDIVDYNLKMAKIHYQFCIKQVGEPYDAEVLSQDDCAILERGDLRKLFNEYNLPEF